MLYGYVRLIMALLALGLAGAPAAAAAPQRFSVTLLPGALTVPFDINRQGDIVGEVLVGNPDRHAFLYRQGVMHDLGTLGGMHSYATALNNAGQVVGSSWVSVASAHAFLFDAAGGGPMRDLGVPGNFSAAADINDAGQVVGAYQAGGGGSERAFVYSGGQWQTIATPGAGSSSAAAINSAGQVVGTYTDGAGQRRGFQYADGRLDDLGTLGGAWATADAISDAGHIAGMSATAGGEARAFLLRDGRMQALENAPGGANSWTSIAAINAQDWLVGGGAAGPLFWADGTSRELNRSLAPGGGWTISRVSGLNELGQIVGEACSSTVCGAVRLDPVSQVPEPPAWTLLLAGAAVVLARRRHAGSAARRCAQGP